MEHRADRKSTTSRIARALPALRGRPENIPTIVGVVVVAIGGGAAAAFTGLGAVLMVGGALLVLFLAANRRYLAISLVLAMFVTRPVAEIGPASVRPEIVVGAAALVSVLGDIVQRRRIPRFQLNLFTAVYLWIAYLAVISMLHSVDVAESISTLAWMAMCATAAFWISVNPDFTGLIVRSAVWVNFAVALSAIFLYGLSNISGYGIGAQFDPAYGGYAVYVLSIEANILGGLVCIWSVICIADPLRQFSSRLRIAMLFIAPVAILATHTRGALAAFVLALVILGITRGRIIASAAFVAVVSWIGLTIATHHDPGLAKFATGLDFSGGTEIVRYTSWKVAWSDISSSAENFVFGSGFNSYGQRHLDPTVPDITRPSYLGNLPLQLLYDGGIITLLVVSMVVFAVWWRAGRAIGFGVATAISVAYMTISIGTSVLWLMETWMLVGLAAANCRRGDSRRKSGNESPGRKAAA